MSNSKKKKKKNNHTSATSNVQAKKQTAVQTAKPAKAQNIETKQETVNTQAAVEKKEPVKVQTIENKQEPPHEFKDPRKVPPKEDLKIEDKLEFATMSRKERRAAKRKRLKETTEGMTLVQKLQYFLYAYKMEILLPLIVIIAISLIVVAFFRGNKPIALSYAVVNCEDLEALDTSVIEADYWNYYGFDDNYQFQKVLDLKYDPSISTNEASKDAESGNYIAFPTLCDENYYDIIITNKRGLEYLSESSIIHTLGEALPSDLYDIFTADYNDQITTSPAYTGKSAPYAINISDTDFAKKLNPGYNDVYICFPGVSEDNQKRSFSSRCWSTEVVCVSGILCSPFALFCIIMPRPTGGYPSAAGSYPLIFCNFFVFFRLVFDIRLPCSILYNDMELTIRGVVHTALHTPAFFRAGQTRRFFA